MKGFLSTLILTLLFAIMHSPSLAQDFIHWQTDLTRPQDYVLRRVSSADLSGGNADFRPIEPGGTLTILDVEGPALLDRKSTRLNSSHVSISYAVFCLKKKKKDILNVV